MTLGEKISLLRKERGLTQAELGNELGVTYQAVSKWERDESMPDFEMMSKLAKFFGVSITHFEHNDEEKIPSKDESDEFEEAAVETVTDPTNGILGVCTVCGKYINKDNVGIETPKLVCKTCRDEQIAQNERSRQEDKRRIAAENQALAASFNKRTVIACIVAGIIAVTVFICSLVGMQQATKELDLSKGEYIGSAVALLILLFTWIFQLFFDGAVRSITLAGMFFIKLPGIIFSADLDGLIFLIVMKVLFFIISAVVFVGAIVVTSLAAMVVSLFTFVPVVIKISRRNEDIL